MIVIYEYEAELLAEFGAGWQENGVEVTHIHMPVRKCGGAAKKVFTAAEKSADFAIFEFSSLRFTVVDADSLARTPERIRQTCWARAAVRESRGEMGPLHRITSLFNASSLDLNNNSGLSEKKKQSFSSDLNIFARESEKIKTKAHIWTSMRLTRKSKGS